MLRAYGPGCDGTILEASRGSIPDGATWIDLEEPTREEEKLVEERVGLDVPTRDEMAEIEPSSRLYERGGMLYLTASVLFGVEEGTPSSEPISFVLTHDRLVTIRYVTPKPVRAFMAHVHREPSLAVDAMTALFGLLDAIVDRLADELEDLGAEVERISQHIFQRSADEGRIPTQRLTDLLTRIGRAQSLLARIRETAVSTSRLISFLAGSARMSHEKEPTDRSHVDSLAADAASLIDHSGFLANNLTFLLDASLGLISVEQNAIIKIFSVAAVIFLPPTLVGTVYGMNFEHMPELKWLFGYPFALGMMVLSAILPYWFFKRRGWL